MENQIENQLLAATGIIEQQVDAAIQELGDIADYRKKRLEALKRARNQREEWSKAGHGTYDEVTDEKDFFNVCKKSKNVVCHFYRSSTIYCSVVDKHLSLLAPKHLEAKFIKINAEKSPFLVERLRIKVMPTICLIKDGKSVDFIVGFGDLGGKDDFPTAVLGERIAKAGIIEFHEDVSSKNTKSNFITKQAKSIRGRTRNDSSSDDDD